MPESIVDVVILRLTSLVNNVVAAAIILLVGFIAGRLCGKLVERILSEIEVNKFVQSITRASFPADEMIGSLVQFFIYFFAIIVALETLQLEAIFFNMISVLLVFIILLSVGLSLKDFVPNVFAGIFVHQSGLVMNGDVIKINGIEGTVLSVGLTDTRIESKGDLVFVPNTYLSKNLVIVRRKHK